MAMEWESFTPLTSSTGSCPNWHLEPSKMRERKKHRKSYVTVTILVHCYNYILVHMPYEILRRSKVIKLRC